VYLSGLDIGVILASQKEFDSMELRKRGKGKENDRVSIIS
jgi:hypothetical protein